MKKKYTGPEDFLCVPKMDAFLDNLAASGRTLAHAAENYDIGRHWTESPELAAWEAGKRYGELLEGFEKIVEKFSPEEQLMLSVALHRHAENVAAQPRRQRKNFIKGIIVVTGASLVMWGASSLRHNLEHGKTSEYIKTPKASLK